MSFALLVVGGIISVVGAIMIWVEAFKENVWWGIGSLLFAPVGLVFVFLHWEVGRKPFFIQLAGGTLAIIGMLLMPEAAETLGS